ncbi:SigB/SigF/SigG family RNA polymerase sigma factor [Streptacidiphilus monticola]|uniref:SigB/SigF/SigG family RNA polymerase sigma factor n=1 Tax=Streptacidiphilus monticola TaxID=2161674 RepID=A0ABW1G2J6_9ACTN
MRRAPDPEASVPAAVLPSQVTTVHGLPEIPEPRSLSTAESRALSRVLFTRMHELDEGTPEYARVRHALIDLNLALVKFEAARVRSRTLPMEDVFQVGVIGLMKAIDRFDPTREVEFPTFALPTIAGEIKRFFRDSTWSVRVPRRLQELRLDLLRAGDELEQRLGRRPTATELAAHLRLSVDEVIEGQAAANAYTAGSLDAPAESEEAEGPLARRLGYEDGQIEKIENLEAIRPVLKILPDRDRTILALRFVDDLTQAQIGARLGISQMHVSRLLSAALTALRSELLAEG